MNTALLVAARRIVAHLEVQKKTEKEGSRRSLPNELPFSVNIFKFSFIVGRVGVDVPVNIFTISLCEQTFRQ